jgi:hypothetical protein
MINDVQLRNIRRKTLTGDTRTIQRKEREHGLLNLRAIKEAATG